MNAVPDTKEGLSLLGLPAGQEMQRAERWLFLPCRIAARRRSSRSSALLYCAASAMQFAFYHSAFFMPKMDLFSKLKWACFRC